MKACHWCGASLEGKRPHAKYCDRTCKVKASDRRRVEDGRANVRDRARYAKEANHRRAYAMRYLAENPERMRAIRRKRRGQLRAERLTFDERDWARLLLQYRGCCAYCGQTSDDLHREHVIPLSRGGRHSVGNIVPACPPCNLTKKSKLLSEWRLQLLKGGDSRYIPSRRAISRFVADRSDCSRPNVAA